MPRGPLVTTRTPRAGAVSAVGRGSASGRTAISAAPLPPTAVTAVAQSPYSVRVYWTSRPFSEIVDVYRVLGSGTPDVLIASVPAVAGTYLDESADELTEYRYGVRASTGGNASSQSNMIGSVTTPNDDSNDPPLQFDISEYGVTDGGVVDDTVAVRQAFADAIAYLGTRPNGTVTEILWPGDYGMCPQPTDPGAAANTFPLLDLKIPSNRTLRVLGTDKSVSRMTGYCHGMLDPTTNWRNTGDSYGKTTRFIGFNIITTTQSGDCGTLEIKNLTINGQAGWTGDYTVGGSLKIASVASVQAAGSGYVVGDLIRINVSGSVLVNLDHCELQVTSVSGGAVTGLQVNDGGTYTSLPSSTTFATTALSGTGTGCTIKVTSTPTGDGWCLGHKGLVVNGSRPVSGLKMTNCDVINFRGECIYAGGDALLDQQLTDVRAYGTNASAVSCSSRCTYIRLYVGGPDEEHQVHNGIENFSIKVGQDNYYEDCTFERATANACALLGADGTSFGLLRCLFKNNGTAVLLSDMLRNGTFDTCRFEGNGKAFINSVLGLYPGYPRAFDNIIIKDCWTDSDLFIGQGTSQITNLQLLRNAQTNGEMFNGQFNTKVGFLATGNVFTGTAKAAGTINTATTGFPLWSGTVGLTAGVKVDHFTLITEKLLVPFNERCWLNEQSPVVTAPGCAVILATILDGKDYPVGFTTTVYAQVINRWFLKNDPTRNTFGADIPITTLAAGGITVRMNVDGKWELA